MHSAKGPVKGSLKLHIRLDIIFKLTHIHLVQSLVLKIRRKLQFGNAFESRTDSTYVDSNIRNILLRVQYFSIQLVKTTGKYSLFRLAVHNQQLQIEMWDDRFRSERNGDSQCLITVPTFLDCIPDTVSDAPTPVCLNFRQNRETRGLVLVWELYQVGVWSPSLPESRRGFSKTRCDIHMAGKQNAHVSPAFLASHHVHHWPKWQWIAGVVILLSDYINYQRYVAEQWSLRLLSTPRE